MIVRVHPDNPHSSRMTFYLNDEVVTGAVFADDENGVIYRLKAFGSVPAANSKAYSLAHFRRSPETDDFEMEMLTGDVKIVLAPVRC